MLSPNSRLLGPAFLTDRPIEEQGSLFSLLPGVTESIGVELQENMLMVPRKSLSGILFPTEVSFFTCQLCSRARCERRKAKYNEELAKEYGLIWVLDAMLFAPCGSGKKYKRYCGTGKA